MKSGQRLVFDKPISLNGAKSARRLSDFPASLSGEFSVAGLFPNSHETKTRKHAFVVACSLLGLLSPTDAYAIEFTENFTQNSRPLGLIAGLSAALVGYLLVANVVDQHVTSDKPAFFFTDGFNLYAVLGVIAATLACSILLLTLFVLR